MRRCVARGLVAVSQALDVVTTWMALVLLDAAELNPFLAPILQALGTHGGMVVVGLVKAVVVVLFCYRVTSPVAVKVGVVVSVAPVAWNAGWIIAFIVVVL